MFTVLFTGDMLGGHLDDMEKDWSKPIVSVRYCDSFSSVFFGPRTFSILKTGAEKRIMSFG